MGNRRSGFERPPIQRSHKSGIGGKIVALFLGTIIGASATLGAVAGVGVAVYKKTPVKKTVDTVSSLIDKNLPLNEYLSDEYSAKTLQSLISSLELLVADVKAQKASFGSLAKASPAVEKAVNKLAEESLQLGVTLSKEELVKGLMDTPFSELGKYISDNVIGTITVGSMLQKSGKIPFSELAKDSNKIVRLILYGVEGEDYTIDRVNKTFQPIKGGRAFLTFDDLSHLNTLIEDIPLEALLPVSEENEIMNALAYGSSLHYSYQTVKEDETTTRKAVMNPRYYTVEVVDNTATVYDETGKALDCTVTNGEADGEYLLTYGEGDNATHEYLAPSKDVNGAFDVFTNAYKNVRVRYKKTTFGDFMDKEKDTFKSLEIGALLGVENSKNPDKLMIALAYGVEGEDYYYENGVRKFYPGKAPKTIGDLTKDNALTELMNKMPLDSLMPINPANEMLATLAYGKISHYIVETKIVDGETVKSVKMLQVRYTKQGDKYYDIDGNEVTVENGVVVGTTHYLKEKDGTYYAYKTKECKEGDEIEYSKTTINDLQNETFFDSMEIGPLLGVSPLDKDSDTLLISLAYGNKGEHFNIKDLDGDGKDDIEWLTDGTGKKYAPRTIAQFRQPQKLFETVYIADALKITPNSHSILLSLAYGEYELENGEIKYEGKKRTIGQLMDEKQSKELVDSITLENALSITADTQSSILKTLAFGNIGKHYTIETVGSGENATKKIVMSQVQYTKVGEKYYDIDGKEVAVENGIVKDTNHHLTLKDGVYLAFDETGKPIKYTKITIGQLSKDPESLINTITLGDAIDVKDEENADALKRAIAYSKDGKPYTIGDLRTNTEEVIYNIHLDSVMQPKVSAKTTLYLLYGRKDVHFRIVSETTDANATKITDDTTTPATTKYVQMLPKIMTVHLHEAGGENPAYDCLHNEYGEPITAPVTRITNGEIVTHPFDNNPYQVTYSYVLQGVTYYLLAPTGETPEISTVRLKGKTGDKGLTDVNRYAPAYYVMTQENGVKTYPMYEHNTIAVLADSKSTLLTHLTERLTLDELMEDSKLNSNSFLEPLKHTTIDELPDAINALKIVDVFEYKVYAKHQTSTEQAPVYVNRDGEILEKINDKWYIKDTTTESARAFEGRWKYLLDCNLDQTHKDYRAPESYTVTEIDLLIPNMTSSMQKARLYDLQEDKIIDLDEGMLRTPVTVKHGILSTTEIELPLRVGDTTELKTIDELGITQLGQMTVEQMLAYIKGLLS